ncbi:diguanylate cyclase (GGDEF) domain-containing protein [Altererythrobacter xiamenensis]|uniref:Diguanylate cyclase (GGDEF) domain-containing protein n=1 Tax=Altererythrobacter xiamenensis TaxID=1316679 RepID=A0A1Y6F9G0_9SPHN|nr:sensor domain-containing diguanylate cyclase [Altererythrobacter xiamenensis]SMQ69382.1 diguanylate cyclase (GGDEF) domain-containing protein [Altererythrobacter xiamenensis]
MIRGFSVDDGTVLFGLLAEGSGDILLKTDGRGFIVEASPSLEQLNIRLSEYLVAPHIADLAKDSHTRKLRAHSDEALRDAVAFGQFEFPARECGQEPFTERWFSLTLRPIAGADGETDGAIAIMRAIERRHALEDELLAASMTDPLTGLANRQAFNALLSPYLDSGAEGSIILFGIDRFRAINLRYGQTRADEVLWAFAQFLRAVLGENAIISRMEGERFAVILPDCDPATSLEIAQEAVTTFGELSKDSGCEQLPVTASAGVSAIQECHDTILRDAEFSLTLAQAGGGGRADLGGEVPILIDRRRIA